MTLASFVVAAFAIFRTVAFLTSATVQSVSVISFLNRDKLFKRRVNLAYRASLTVGTSSVLLCTIQAYILVVSVAFRVARAVASWTVNPEPVVSRANC